MALVTFAAPTAQAADTGISVSKIVINGGKPIVVGTSAVVKPRVTFSVTLPAGYSTANPFAFAAHPFLYHGTTASRGAQSGGIYFGSYTCYEDSVRAEHCDGAFYIEPRYRLDSNNDATTWKIGVVARLFKSNGNLKAEEYWTAPGGVQVKRQARATGNASPEPVRKGKALTVTGSLTRADWVKHKYTGYGNQAVKLQFCKKGGSTYTTVKTVRTSSTGVLKTTVTASLDGYWRWTFGGTSTTGAAASAGDFVDVR
jgi:hypothetical protein